MSNLYNYLPSIIALHFAIAIFQKAGEIVCKLMMIVCTLPFIACPIGVYFMMSNIVIPISAYLTSLILLLFFKWCCCRNQVQQENSSQEDEVPCIEQRDVTHGSDATNRGKSGESLQMVDVTQRAEGQTLCV